MKNKISKLTEVELQIMTGVWRFRKPVTIKEIHQRLFPDGEKAYTTVQTMMNILARKNFLRCDKIGMVNFYFPNITEEEYAKRETSSFVSRIFKGSFGELANYLIDSGELSGDELKRLRILIEQKEKQAGGKS